MKKTGHIEYPPLINEQALYIGGLRDTVNQYTSAKYPEYARPNLQVDQLGCKAEMIAQYFFWSNKIEHEPTQMLGVDPIKDADIIVGKKRIDVKGLWSYIKELRVNKKGHLKEKNITHYLFIKPKSDALNNEIAQWWLFTHQEISNWQIKKLTYTDAFVRGI